MTGTRVGKEVGTIGTNESTFTWRPKGSREDALRIDTRMTWREVNDEWQVELSIDVVPDRGSHGGITISSEELGDTIGEWTEIGEGITVLVEFLSSGPGMRELEFEIHWRAYGEEHRFNVKRHPTPRPRRSASNG